MTSAGLPTGWTGYVKEALPLADAVYGLLRDLIVQRTGILYDDTKRGILADKLSDLAGARGLTSLLDYYYLLRYDENAEAEWARVADRLAVPETFFWRQPDHFETTARVIAPAYFAAHPTRPLRIWSAACCTGEEPISIAIALAEAGLDNRPIEIVGTDASQALIERARRGSYSGRSFRQLPAPLREKYFEPDADGRERPIARVSRMVRYEVANLARRESTAPYSDAHVIFCRNVFIYFADAAVRDVVQGFARTMPADGYLFVGASESLTRLGVDLQLTELGGSFVYVKPGRADLPTRASAIAARSRHAEVSPPGGT